MSTDLIAERSPRELDAGLLAWMVGIDARALEARDCGCGEPVTLRIVRLNHPRGVYKPIVVEVIFFHGGVSRCQMAFDYEEHFQPLTYEAYCRLMEIEE